MVSNDKKWRLERIILADIFMFCLNSNLYETDMAEAILIHAHANNYGAQTQPGVA